MTHVDVAARASRNQTKGSERTKRTVWRSGASMRSTISSVGRLPLLLRPRKRSYVYLTSSAVSSRPLTGGLACQRTPLRSLKIQVVSLGWLHDSARSPSTGYVPGFTHGPALTLTRRPDP